VQPERQGDHVARGGHLLRIGQAGGIAELGVLHAELVRLAVHELGELRLAAGDMLGYGDGHVVGRLDDQSPDGVTNGDLGALLDLQPGRRRPRRIGREPEGGGEREPPLLQKLEQQIERHQLGERGRVAQLVGAALIECSARIGIHGQNRPPGDLLGPSEQRLQRKDRSQSGSAEPAPQTRSSPQQASTQLEDHFPLPSSCGGRCTRRPHAHGLGSAP
jgi:hypothetical protein